MRKEPRGSPVLFEVGDCHSGGVQRVIFQFQLKNPDAKKGPLLFSVMRGTC